MAAAARAKIAADASSVACTAASETSRRTGSGRCSGRDRVDQTPAGTARYFRGVAAEAGAARAAAVVRVGTASPTGSRSAGGRRCAAATAGGRVGGAVATGAAGPDGASSRPWQRGHHTRWRSRTCHRVPQREHT